LHLTEVPHLNYDRGLLSLSLRTRPGDLRAVRLKVGERRYPMSLVAADDLYARYSMQLPWSRKQDLSYEFELLDGSKVAGFGANGLANLKKLGRFASKPPSFSRLSSQTGWSAPSFIRSFPIACQWQQSQRSGGCAAWDVKPTWFNRLGGDAQGVRQHVPHLVNLGVSAVYFNPIFKAPSNHRYDAEDFKQIDPQFGTNAEFAALTRELKAKNIRTVLDFVFNHTATTFPPFADIREKGEASTYKDWYFIKSYPVKVQENPNYVAWFNYPSMPKLNLANPATRDYMLDLVDFWHRTVPLAGLRLDVANEVSSDFWRDLRKRTKKIDPQMWIVGEVWGDGSPWLAGDQWDSVMNYQFLFANRDFFAEGKAKPSEYSERLMRLYRSYVPQVSRNMMNLLSSHDTPRFLTLCNNNQDLHRLAATVQFTWVGAPSVYYGEELGMQGGADPDNRRGMEWDLAKPTNPMLRYYKKLIRLRNASRALQSGDPAILMTDDRAQTLAYSRTLGNEIAIVALNRSDKPQTLTVPLPRTGAMQAARKSGLVDGISGRNVPLEVANSVRVTLAPQRAAVFATCYKSDAWRSTRQVYGNVCHIAAFCAECIVVQLNTFAVRNIIKGGVRHR
jgi:glycosidase